MNLKPQRIRDPLHDLIEFDTTEFEQGLWKVLDTAEFQRLRRIRQLGFSELVYPGATHTRFLHSVGVFHTARTLLGVAAKALGPDYDPERAKVALAAALVHDVGHGPFSHAFETATKQLAKRRGSKSATRHEIWTGEIIRGDTALGGSIEALLGEDGRKDVASLLLQETPTDIYSAIVSSQLDADRLDYIRRDRLMTGAQHGGFDFPWLLANLEVDEVTFATDDEEFASAQMLILGSKSFQAAEAFVLGLFHLYFAVYFHKATRSAEKMLTALLVRIGALCDNGMQERTGLEPTHPLVAFVNDATLGNYLSLR
ncbi:MAG: HD domain-containing protein [Hyphomicrobiales bacterium]